MIKTQHNLSIPKYKFNLLLLIIFTLVLGTIAVLSEATKNTYVTEVILANIFLIIFLVSIASLYKSAACFIFSSSFWMVITIFFYYVLKSIFMALSDEPENTLPALSLIILFCLFYIAGHVSPSTKKQENTRFISINWEKMWKACLLTFITSKIAFYFLMTIVVGEANDILTVVEKSENMGMAYIFRAFVISNIAYFFLAYRFYTARQFGYTVAALTVYLIFDYSLHASRSGIIILLLSHLVLYHKYRKPLPLMGLALLSPFLIFIISFFGYVRNLGIGDIEVYIDTLKLMADEFSIIFTLFMARMDVLPIISDAIVLNSDNTLESLFGSSYIYAWLHFIPRSLWLEKPPLTAAYVTSIARPGLFSDGVNIYPSIFLEAYLNAKWVGVAITGFLTGFLCRKYDQLFNSTNPIFTVWCLIFLSFPMGLINEGIHSNFLANLIYTSFIYFVFILILKKNKIMLSIKKH